MSGKILFALLASVSCLCFTNEALAIDASTEPTVVYAREPAPVRMASAERANMGGGFIEFLFGDAPQGNRYQQQRPLDPKYEKQMVEYHGRESPGTIVIDTPNKFLFLVQGDGKALRYGVGVGRPGFTWSGVKTVSAKKEWPAWTPPPEMLVRRPDLPRFMEGGPQNPLGARAMYLGSSLYRIHGSNEPWTIGTNVSSGCIRMRNEDVIDLYGRVNVGARVVVI
jgi:lipoprotein-anchoring transpeptidase ErfK/SrfK